MDRSKARPSETMIVSCTLGRSGGCSTTTTAVRSPSWSGVARASPRAAAAIVATIDRDVMRRAVTAKFTQHAALQALLLSTGDAVLVERTPRDHFWGDGGDSSGQNWLGRILMEVRAALREAG